MVKHNSHNARQWGDHGLRPANAGPGRRTEGGEGRRVADGGRGKDLSFRVDKARIFGYQLRVGAPGVQSTSDGPAPFFVGQTAPAACRCSGDRQRGTGPTHGGRRVADGGRGKDLSFRGGISLSAACDSLALSEGTGLGETIPQGFGRDKRIASRGGSVRGRCVLNRRNGENGVASGKAGLTICLWL